MKNQKALIRENQNEKCKLCRQNPVEIFQDNIEVCVICWQVLTYPRGYDK